MMYSFVIHLINQICKDVDEKIYLGYVLLKLSVSEKETALNTQKRLSVRAIALKYGLPTRVIFRAVSVGELPAVLTKTETGRERVYILINDAESWFLSLSTFNDNYAVVGDM